MTDDQLKAYYILASEMFPKMEIQKAIERFATDREGDIVFLDDDGQVKKVTPSMWKGGNWGSRLGANVAQAGEVAPDIVGGVAEVATALATKSPHLAAAAGAGAATATNLGRQAAGDYFFKASRGDKVTAENLLTSLDPVDAALEGALYWLTSQPFILGGKLLGKMRNTNPLKAPVHTLPEVEAAAPAAETLLRSAEKEGIDLTVPQAVGDEGLLIRERQLRRRPEAATEYRRFFEDQYDQIMEKIHKDLLPKLGQAELTSGAVLMMKNAADEIFRIADLARTQAVEPYYREAFDSGIVPDVSRIVRSIERRLALVSKGGAANKELTKAKRLIRPGKTEHHAVGEPSESFYPDSPASFEALHDAKINLDGIIADLVDNLKGSQGKSALHHLEAVRKELVETLRKAHPSYDAGADLYITMSGPIDRMGNGAIGLLRSLNPTDVTAANHLGQVFSALKVADADAVKEMRQLFVDNGKLDIFNKGFSAYLQETVERIVKQSADVDPASLSLKLYKNLFKTPKQREVLQAAVGDPKVYSDFHRFFDIIRAISKTKGEGSATATDLPAMDEIGGSIARTVQTGTRPMHWARRFGEWLMDQSTSAGAAKLAQLYTTEAGRQALRQTRAIKPGVRASAHGINRILVTAFGEGMFDQPRQTAFEARSQK